MMTKRSAQVRAWLLVVWAAASSCSHWPPVVATAEDASGLPSGQKSIRCIGCDDEALAVIGRRFQDLEYLFINDQARISDEGLRAISTLRRLRQLEVGSASRLADTGIKAIKQLPSLEELSIDNAPLISSGALRSLGESLKLKRVYMKRCTNASVKTVQALRQLLPNADVRAFE